MVQNKTSDSYKELMNHIRMLKEEVKLLGIQIRAMRKEMKGGDINIVKEK